MHYLPPHRTEEQLGYVVFSQIKTLGDVKHVMILVQGDAYDPIHVGDRIESFVASFRKMIMDMPEEEFASNIEAVVQVLTEKKKNLVEEAYGHWQHIANGDLQFDRLKKIAHFVNGVTKEDVLRLYDRFLLAGSPLRRKLSVQVFGSQHLERMNDPVPEGVNRIDDVDAFARNVSLYPLAETVVITDDMRMKVTVTTP